VAGDAGPAPEELSLDSGTDALTGDGERAGDRGGCAASGLAPSGEAGARGATGALDARLSAGLLADLGRSRWNTCGVSESIFDRTLLSLLASSHTLPQKISFWLETTGWLLIWSVIMVLTSAIVIDAVTWRSKVRSWPGVAHTFNIEIGKLMVRTPSRGHVSGDAAGDAAYLQIEQPTARHLFIAYPTYACLVVVAEGR
jgi:hypothetical protein